MVHGGNQCGQTRVGNKGTWAGWWLCVGECLGSTPWGTARLGPVKFLIRTVKK